MNSVKWVSSPKRVRGASVATKSLRVVFAFLVLIAGVLLGLGWTLEEVWETDDLKSDAWIVVPVWRVPGLNPMTGGCSMIVYLLGPTKVGLSGAMLLFVLLWVLAAVSRFGLKYVLLSGACALTLGVVVLACRVGAIV